MKHLIFFVFLFCYASNILSQTDDFSLHLAPGSYDSICIKQLCAPESVPQYYSVNAKNAKSSYQILKEWQLFIKNTEGVNLPSGFLTIRFFVNCKGEPCCFRFYEIDEKYVKTAYPQGIKDQLIAFVQQLGGWKQVEKEGIPKNYYYYLTFKIQKNEFKTVAP